MITDEMIRYESGDDTPEELAYFAFLREVQRLLGLNSLDGDQSVEGYSLDCALIAFNRGDTPLFHANMINCTRHQMGLPMLIMDWKAEPAKPSAAPVEMTPSKARRARLRAMCNRLALTPAVNSRSIQRCVFCNLQINVDDLYRNAGHNAKAHDLCFKSVAASC